MQIGVYQNAAAMTALDRWNNAIAHNLAAGSNAGFRRTSTVFRAEPAGQVTESNHIKDPNEITKNGLFPISQQNVDFKPGSITGTGRPLDVAIASEGFFEVRRPDGSTAFTRNGSFHTRADRTLVDARGNEVLGLGGAAIQLLPDEPNIAIAPDGSISQGESVIGKLSVVQFSDNSKLIPIEDGYFKAPSTLQPEPSESLVQQGALESSNTSAIREMVDMITVSRAYQASQKVITTHDEILDKALRTLG